MCFVCAGWVVKFMIMKFIFGLWVSKQTQRQNYICKNYNKTKDNMKEENKKTENNNNLQKQIMWTC